ncbi:UdgX family uracil-DNA binding protein [Planctomicrobium piriforme]|uniref:Type-4 uracil-DNA glycosylase n=1 Tax=Planctomicrobium piriforme TaxID=1576369 RepID=A0A1I3MGZ8_9PLAN|nr:UdgX family uracil-DNA binding protein [Planctomicrobium piriforme]SFI96192.1 DNA polymerase [Planctomicrobium piriforme]
MSRFLTVSDFEEWRAVSRGLLAEGVAPADVQFNSQSAQSQLFSDQEEPKVATTSFQSRVSPRFLELARRVACHREDARWQRLYQVLWRLTHGEPSLLDITTDDDVQMLLRMDAAVRRDAHKAKAFVRFRKVVEGDREEFIAWHRPDHFILRLVAPFLSRRFPHMHWAILTPEESVVWDQNELAYGPGVPRSVAPEADELEVLWKTYYGSIFNPARIKLKMMVREMPVRHWPTLPEASLIPDLLADADRRVQEMLMRQEGNARSARDFLPESLDYPHLVKAAEKCRGCDLHQHATQTVFGVGPTSARLVLVGEQPGDQEDLAGEPFVGPAGEVLDEALHEAGIDRRQTYVTNAVKHFKFTLRGKRRLHQKPDAREVNACRPWLEAELGLIRPEVLICLGATAAQALIGRDFRITRQRGEWLQTDWCDATIATYHPSALLRVPDAEQRAQMRRDFIADLTKAARRLTQND